MTRGVPRCKSACKHCVTGSVCCLFYDNIIGLRTKGDPIKAVPDAGDAMIGDSANCMLEVSKLNVNFCHLQATK